MTNPETEKLREKIIDVSRCPIPNNKDESNCPKGVTYCKDCELAIADANKIILADKEAGLKFVPAEWILERLTFRTRDITGEVVEAINSQIKEIELE